MNDLQLSSMALYFFGAILLSFVGVVVLAWFIDVQSHAHRWILSLVFPIILLGIAASALLTDRDVRYAETELTVAAGTDSPMLIWCLRLITGLLLALCVARLISVSQQNEMRQREGKSLYLAFLFLFASNVILNNVFGEHPEFDQRSLYPLVLFTTLYFSRNKDKNTTIDATKIGMLLFFVGCFLTAWLIPRVALQINYEGWIPHLNVRLWGIGPGPNAIGPLSVVFLLLLMHRPFSHRLLQWAALLVGLGVFILSQSKTAWFAAAVCVPILWWYHMLYPMHRKPSIALRTLSGPLLVCVLGLLAVAGALVYNLYGDHLAFLTRDEEVMTLTGRTSIWRIAFDTWSQYPVFGYGSAMWNEHFRDLIGMSFAYHSHNQFLQCMSVAGTVGLMGLLIYLVVLFRYVLAANKESRGLSLALFAMLIIRSFTEIPFDLSGIFTGDFITHLLLFRIVLVKTRQFYAEPTAPQFQQQAQPSFNLG
jgi:hypothetical protein